MRALLSALIVVLAFAAPAAAQDAVDRAAEALQDDPVYVDPAADAEVDAEELRQRIEAEGINVRIAVLPDSAGAPREVAPELAERVGEPGTYAVVVGNTLLAGPSSEAANAAREAAEENRGEGAQAARGERRSIRRAGGGGD